jgi:glucose/mannose-6-phosphate isomerase
MTRGEVRPASVLDDATWLREADTGGMLGLVAVLGEQLRRGFEIGRTTPTLPSPEGLRSIVVCGMGGSGISGDIVRALYGRTLSIPISVGKGYRLPESCGQETLVLAVSYSGNTEEAIEAYTQAVARGCRVVAVCAGGELAALAEADDVPRVAVPDASPVPRAALGYLAAGCIGVLHAMGLIPDSTSQIARTSALLDRVGSELGPHRPAEENEAKSLAAWLTDRTPVVWGTEGVAEAAALRWKTQLNENAKVPAWASVLPELDHNEVEGWSSGAGRPYGLVVLRHHGEHPRMAARVEGTLEVIRSAELDARQATAAGEEPMQWLFSLIMLGDFVSTYLGLALGVDPTPIPTLVALKERLSGLAEGG